MEKGSVSQSRLAIVLSLMTCSICGFAHAQAEAVPFVAGFERFARHQEIDKVTAGRLLLTELSCTACHTSNSDDLKPKLGPQLDGAGNRLGHE